MTSMPPNDPKRVRDFYERLGAELVRPDAAEHHATAGFNRKAWQALAEAGMFRIGVREELGGRGGTLDACTAAVEGLALGSTDLGFAVSAAVQIVAASVLERFGNRVHHDEFLPRLLSGEWVAALANAEPGAGTDLMGLKSKAVSNDDRYLLTIRKRSITNLGAADLALCSVRVEGQPPARSINVFAVPTATERVYMRPIRDLTGLRTSPTGDLVARRARLPASLLLGELGDGVKLFRFMFCQERIFTGHMYLAALRYCLRRSLEHAERREQFGQPIGRNQYVQGKIVSMRVAEELLATYLEACRRRYQAGEDVFGDLSVIKAYGIEAALEASRNLVGLLGSRGLRQQEAAGRLQSDLMGMSVLGGTVELQKIILYSELVKRGR